MTITIHAPTPGALEAIASRMCAEDAAELEACGWVSPLTALQESCASSRESYVAYWDGEPQAAFGVADFTLDDAIGVPWMLSTGPKGRVAREFIQTSHQYISEWSPLYSVLFNFVDVRHLRAQRWLLSLGFVPLKVHDLGVHPFIEFGRYP